MSIILNFLLCLIYVNSLSCALQCTTDCFFQLNFHSPFEIPEKCNQTTSASQCQLDLSISYRNKYILVLLSAVTSSYSFNDNHFALIQLVEDGFSTFSYGTTRYCKNKNDCARQFVEDDVLDMINRLSIDYQAIRDELSPLLSSNSSVENSDLSCFDSDGNVRQCAIATKPAACQVVDELTGSKPTSRTCDNGLFISSSYVSIFDSHRYASFTIRCNRFLCNGPITLEAVKEIMFKYNVTKTIEGRLNHGLHLSLSSTFLTFILSLFFERYNSVRH